MKAILDILHKWCNWNNRKFRIFKFSRNHSFTIEFINGNVTVWNKPNTPGATQRSVAYHYEGTGEVQTETIYASNIFRSVRIETSGVKYLMADGEVLIDER